MKIHGYPYDPTVTDYTDDPLTWPYISAQGHWRPGNDQLDTTTVPQLISPSLVHLHLEAHAPVYAEITQNFTMPFTLLLFNVQGRIRADYGTFLGPLVSNVVWDTPDGQPIDLVGQPNAHVQMSGRFTVNLSQADGSGNSGTDVPPRGWFTVRVMSRVYFDDGDRLDVFLHLPFYSMLDPSAPESHLTQQNGPAMRTWAGAVSVNDTPADAIGLYQITEYDDYLPILAPFSVNIPGPTAILGGYGTQALPMGTGSTRFDMDLHNGNPGTLLQTLTAPSLAGVVLNSPFDPAKLGPGVHKVAAIWEQDTGVGVPGLAVANEQANSLLVVTVTVGAVNPQHPTLTSVLPNAGVQGTSVPVTLTGTNFVTGATTVTVAGGGVTASSVSVTSPTSLTATLVIDPMAQPGARSVSVTTANGTSGLVTFTVMASPVQPVWTTVPGVLQQDNSMPPMFRFCTDPMQPATCRKVTFG